jgi:hypothetical protein
MLQLNDDNINNRINELIDLKGSKKEDYLHPPQPLLNSFLIETIDENERVANSLKAGNGDVEELNKLFRMTIKGFEK